MKRLCSADVATLCWLRFFCVLGTGTRSHRRTDHMDMGSWIVGIFLPLWSVNATTPKTNDGDKNRKIWKTRPVQTAAIDLASISNLVAWVVSTLLSHHHRRIESRWEQHQIHFFPDWRLDSNEIATFLKDLGERETSILSRWISSSTSMKFGKQLQLGTYEPWSLYVSNWYVFYLIPDMMQTIALDGCYVINYQQQLPPHTVCNLSSTFNTAS